MIRQTWTLVAAGTVAIALLVGCAAQTVPGPPGSPTNTTPPAATATQARAQAGPPVTLRLADAEAQGRSSQPWIDEFIAKVTADSGGTITIEPIYKAGGGNVDSPGESIVAGQVMSGEVELALVPVRAWSDVGVTSLQALIAPVLIDSDELLTAVASDPLVEPLLDGMLQHGVIGLSAWPDGLRHLFAWEANGPPFLNASDLEDSKVWLLKSDIQSMMLEGMGAIPVTSNVAELDTMVADGSLRGVESSFGAISSLSGKPTGTGDVVVYPKYQVLAADDAAFSRLTADQQNIIRDAATAARDLAIEDYVPDSELAQAWCEQGGRVVLAGEANAATFLEAAEPVLATLAEDPVTAAALDAIRALKERTAPPTVAACEPPADPNAPWPSVAPGPALTLVPDGVYVHTVSEDELLEADADPADARNNAGKWTLTVTGDHGSWFLQHQSSGIGVDETFPLDFELLDDHIRFQQKGSPSFNDVRWRLDEGTLYLEIVGSDWNTAQAQSVLNVLLGGAWTQVE